MLARAPGVDAEALRAAFVARDSLAGIVSDPPEALSESARLFLRTPSGAVIESDLRWIERSGAHLVPCTSTHYPPLLASVAHAPAVLYVLGDPSVLVRSQLAMVGSRAATPGGRATAHEMAARLASAGLAIVSGLAVGIDAASHEGALAGGGLTIGVCGHGLDRVYPRHHRLLAQRMLERGTLVAECPPGTPPTRSRFPSRNRLISGMALATVVVEAARASGSLITAGCALRQGRPVFAVPGAIRNPLAEGCHRLIRSGARLAATASDVLTDLKIPLPEQSLAAHPEEPRPASPLDKESEMLLDALGFEPVSINTLVERTGLPSASIASMLLILELGGRIAPHPGGRYCRLS